MLNKLVFNEIKFFARTQCTYHVNKIDEVIQQSNKYEILVIIIRITNFDE